MRWIDFDFFHLNCRNQTGFFQQLFTQRARSCPVESCKLCGVLAARSEVYFRCVSESVRLFQDLDVVSEHLKETKTIHESLSAAQLVEYVVRRGEGLLTDTGALACRTGARTGRSPKDKFFVRDAESESVIHWGPVNQPIAAEVFDRLLHRVLEDLRKRELFRFRGFAAAHPKYRIALDFVSDSAWHALFAQCLFLRHDPAESAGAITPPWSEWSIVHAPTFACDPARDGTHSDAAIMIDRGRKIILIVGTQYAGEIKKSVFTVLNDLLPAVDVFPMHCAANVGAAGDVALFFGLSGTGKTTLSADPARRLIGDDEHGWAEDGVFNLEGGCYAKTIRLSATAEPQIWQAIRFGSVLENVPVDPMSRVPDFASESITENTRVAYPIEHIPNAVLSGRAGHPRNIVFLSCDAFGVLPPLAKLSPTQAVDYFLCGYTAKVAGTEAGITEPSATFSTCFGAPFLPLAPWRYAELLKARLKKHGVPVWLLNTGWTGGAYGIGQRMPIAVTRALLSAALDGTLENVTYRPDPIFGVDVPLTCPGVPRELLDPRTTWAKPEEYDRQAKQLADRFREIRQAIGQPR